MSKGVKWDVLSLANRALFYTSEDLKPHPTGDAIIKSVTGNLVEESSAMPIEFFNGVNLHWYKPYLSI